ncbi:MAG TPA: SGNH/GDSL hydrolase family protein [Candidatus Acidoferrum sp.]|nr:SGNH/GDSL hydrolase family protein [Candidatus Acidoferrum sp.]
MRQILVYGDSLSWGIIPETRKRFAFEERWPGALEKELNASGSNVRVIEDCLNGRRTVWEDPFKPGRNGLQGLAQRIEINSPLALVILMLGTNDFQFCHPYSNAWAAAQGVSVLIVYVRWLGNRKGIEEVTTTWDKTVVERKADLENRVQILQRVVNDKRIRKIFAFANNHYAGHAPDTIRLFEKLWPKQ